MNTEKVLVMYALLRAMTNTMSDSHALRLLDWTAEFIGKLHESKTYAKVKGDLRSGEFQEALEEMNANAREIELECGPFRADLNHEALIWILTLKIVMGIFDFNILLITTCFFIAAQETGIHRVEDDRMRLVLTYMHFHMLKQLADGKAA